MQNNFGLPIIAPSILGADLFDMRRAIGEVENSPTNFVHIDVMDGHFVPNLTFGPKFIEDLRKETKIFFDVHLMIEKPELSIDQYIKAGSDSITFHDEACIHSHRLITYIQSTGKKAGISICPSTPVEKIFDLLGELDQVLIMSINPGFGGQKLIPWTLEKVKKLVEFRTKNKLDFAINIDGGVNEATIQKVVEAGCDIVVAGSAFFGAKDKNLFTKNLRDSGRAFGKYTFIPKMLNEVCV